MTFTAHETTIFVLALTNVVLAGIVYAQSKGLQASIPQEALGILRDLASRTPTTIDDKAVALLESVAPKAPPDVVKVTLEPAPSEGIGAYVAKIDSLPAAQPWTAKAESVKAPDEG